MNSFSFKETSREWIRAHLSVFLALVFIPLDLLLMPLETFQFDPDEGLRLSQLILYQQGYRLYRDIPSDQPPLFTVMLDWWSKLCNVFLGLDHNHQVFVARLFVLLFSAILIWTFCEIAQITTNIRSAAIATFLLFFSCNFLRLSLSVMIGLPCLALALLSIYFVVRFKYRVQEITNWKIFIYPFVSGFLLACSLLTKMFTVFLVPLIGFFWLTHYLKHSKKQALLQLLYFLGGGVTVLALFSYFLASVGDISSFFQFHVSSSLKSKFDQESSFLTVFSFYLQDFDYLIVCLWGLISISFSKDNWSKLPIAWLVIITILLINHQPIWYHHYLLISIPLCWLTTLGIERIHISLKQYPQSNINVRKKEKRSFLLAISTVAFMSLAFCIKMYFFSLNNADMLNKGHDANVVLEKVMQYQDETHWLFTDMPMYGVRAKINVPPELSVISRKSLASGLIDQTSITKIIEQYQPEQFVIARFSKLQDEMQDYLDENCEKYSYEAATHFIRKDLLNSHSR